MRATVEISAAEYAYLEACADLYREVAALKFANGITCKTLYRQSFEATLVAASEKQKAWHNSVDAEFKNVCEELGA